MSAFFIFVYNFFKDIGRITDELGEILVFFLHNKN